MNAQVLERVERLLRAAADLVKVTRQALAEDQKARRPK